MGADSAKQGTTAPRPCTLQSCPTFAVAKYFPQLRQMSPCVPPTSGRVLKKLHGAQDYQGMLELIKRTMNIEGRLVVAWVNSGGPDAPAWVEMPIDMPFYGTKEFREMPIKMSIRKAFLEQSSYDQIAIMFAHELSHIVLNSIKHPLRECEKAVDLTAMLLGFRKLYRSACHKESRSGNRVSFQADRLPELGGGFARKPDNGARRPSISV
jgi:hypothetical protein